MPDPTSPRRYRKSKRAEQEEATRQRITEAAVELHRTLGPAKTEIQAVAQLAGVSRMTVYNHFPTEVDLFTACATHWATRNPFPDFSQWAAIEESSERIQTGVIELYRWYRLKEDMLGKVFRDLAVVPALEKVMSGLWSGYAEAIVSTLARGRPEKGVRRKALKAALRLAIDFNTWRSLTGSGLSPERAAELVVRMVTGAFPSCSSAGAGPIEPSRRKSR